MKHLQGIRAAIARSPENFGQAIYLTKYDNGKKYKPKVTIEWVESNGYERIEPIIVDSVDMYSSMDEESKLAGKVEAQKEEIQFLRNELSLALARTKV